MLQHSMEYCSFLLYKLTSVLRRAREYKKRHRSLEDPCRRDIAPTGELAGLPARDAPKTSEVWPRSIAGEALLADHHRLNVPAHKTLLYGIRTGFTRADAQRLLQIEYPHFSVAGFPGPSHVANRLHHLLRNRIVYRQFDLGLG